MRAWRVIVGIGCVAVGFSSCPVAGAGELHGFLTLTTDYVFRGVSQSGEEPTAQAGADYLHSSGVFAGLFIARIDFPPSPFRPDPGQLETDVYLGYSRPIDRDWAWDVAVLHYDYPDAAEFDFSYQELAANLHYRDMARLGVTVSDNAAGGRSSGWTAEIELRQPLGERAQISGALGRYAFERADWRDYLYWDLGVSTRVGPLTIDVRYFDTSSESATFAGPVLTGGRVVGSISVGF